MGTLWIYQACTAVVLIAFCYQVIKNKRLQKRLNLLDEAEAHFCQIKPNIDPIQAQYSRGPQVTRETLERVQVKVCEILSEQAKVDDYVNGRDSRGYQANLDLFFNVSSLINYWMFLHPSESTGAIDAAQRASTVGN